MRLFAGLIALLLLAAPAAAAPQFPPLTGRVVDDAHILSDRTKADLTAKLASLEAKTSRQLVVVTLPSLQGYEIEDYGYQLGRAWGIGQQKLNNGALFIVAPNEHRVRIEVGYGLEGILTDAFSSVAIQTAVLPRFRANDYDGGVNAGVAALIGQLSLDPSAAEAKAAEAARSVKAQRDEPGNPFVTILVIFFVIVVVTRLLRGSRRTSGLWVPIILGNMGRRGGGWGSGGFGGGGFGGSGGGFGGGGGSFGGGGASGRW